MKFTEGELEFDFGDVIDVFKFDEKNSSAPNYHGLSHCMKGVDFIVEQPNVYFFVEIKDPSHSGASAERKIEFEEKALSGSLIKDLVQKYRDTFLYRWAENKLEKPIIYICLVTLESPLIPRLMEELRRQLPEGEDGPNWQHSIVKSAMIVNLDQWNKNFSSWPITRLGS
ncbi:hypothetical protein BJAS_P4083 [Bathymodiolus japonicus methanotrophic gill symbiont]|uniref:hypothetical protein n=1 Tax=Bathymodiolus japonicus methanotrophic gill symbiont TaxID=113269 RepID=UPI001B6ADFAF|nr:hypothetical protein [Bathymodiolus japonicus methanotrophic gill symbiont]GFO73329.1 hypothetical protein BJAS_P4083 [Bathymodiolus japonicus methanotrophic gill symbiont]